MRTYTLPVDLQQEEKIIGGYLSARQSGYIAAGAVLAAWLYFSIPFQYVEIVAAALPAAAALWLAFADVKGERADRYLALLLDRRPKRYFYHKKLASAAENQASSQKIRKEGGPNR